MLNFELFADLLLSSLVLSTEHGYLNNIFLNGGVQLFLKDIENIPRTKKTISVSVVKHKSNQMSLADRHIRELFPKLLELFEVEVGPNLEKIDKPFCKVLCNN